MNKLIMDTLKPTGVPVTFHAYSGVADTYITSFAYNEIGIVFAEDVEQVERLSIQVDIWSKGNYSALVKQVKALMIQAGFTRIYATEMYENDTKIYHKVYRFYYENTGGI